MKATKATNKKKKILTKYLKKVDLSGAQLARRVGVTRSTVALWNIGKNIPHKSNIKKIAEVLEVDYMELLEVFYK